MLTSHTRSVQQQTRSLFRRYFLFTLLLTGFIVINPNSSAVKAATTYPAHDTAQLKAAILNAQPGDEIVLDQGQNYDGTITLINKTCTFTNQNDCYITIRTTAVASLPAGTRVSPSAASLMPKIRAISGGDPALQTEIPTQLSGWKPAHHYRFIGIEFKPIDSVILIHDLIRLGHGGEQTRLDQVPHHIIFDRCYIHGDPNGTLKRGIALNSAHTDIINSYISDFKTVNQDSQAICGWNGPGPFNIINNYLEGGGENVLFGGEDPDINNLVPSDIVFRRNLVSKPLAWRGTYTAKNLFELKNAQRVLIDGNIFQNSWDGGQLGYGILFTTVNQGYTESNGAINKAPWSIVQDVQFTNNIVRHVSTAFQFKSGGPPATLKKTNRIHIANNLFYDMNKYWGGKGYLIQYEGANFDVRIDHNTIDHNPYDRRVSPNGSDIGLGGGIIEVDGGLSQGLIYTNNISEHREFGIKGDNDSSGNSTLEHFFPAAIVLRNVIAGANPAFYPPTENFYPPSIVNVNFGARANTSENYDYRLTASSPYKFKGTDKRDPGCDFDALEAAQSQTDIQTELRTWAVSGKSFAYVKLTFPDSSYQVTDWGQISKINNDISVAATIVRTSGQVIPSSVNTARIYDLGSLANNSYTFTFKNGSATLQRQQFVVNAEQSPQNYIDIQRRFVRQQYLDFLNRPPDQAGWDYWTGNITLCSNPAQRPAGQTEAQCYDRQRETTSAAFFLSPEFQYTGYYVYRMYKGSLGRLPKFSEFVADAQFVAFNIIVNDALSGQKIEDNKRDIADLFVQRPEFLAIYGSLSNTDYVNRLFATTGINASAQDRQTLVTDLNNGVPRARILQKIVDGILVIAEGNQQFQTTYGKAFYDQEKNPAFVLMEYFGYLRRDPDPEGYSFWLGKLNTALGDYIKAEMVRAFIISPEYRSRFGDPKPSGTSAGNAVELEQAMDSEGGVVQVYWTSAIGVTVSGNSITSTASGWNTSGAVSNQAIVEGNGYVEFTASETNTYRMCGLSHGNTNQDYTDIDFALYLADNGQAHIYEAGTYRGAVGPYAAGDRFRVAVENGTVVYRKNGVLLYTSYGTPNYPLLVDTALYSTGATVGSAIISGFLDHGVSAGSVLFNTSFESGQTQPNWFDSADYIVNVTGYCCGLTSSESSPRQEAARLGTSALMYSGTDTSAVGPSYSYNKVFNVNIPVTANTELTYWIYPQAVSGNNSAFVSIDLFCTDGSSLRDSGAVDQWGVRLHPAFQGAGGRLSLNQWNLIRSKIGTWLAGKTIYRIYMAYDQPQNTGSYRGYIDDISLVNSIP